MTQEKVKIPIPSMVNYPEPPAGATTNTIGFDDKGARYKVDGSSSTLPQHAEGWRTSEASTTSAQASWTNFNTNTDKISGSTGTYTQITLKAGSTYKIQGYVGCLLNGQQVYFKVLYQWYDITQGQFIGTPGGGSGGSSGSHAGLGSAPAVVYFTPVVDSTIELRRTQGSWDYLEEGTAFNIEII
jgi:hypothetical protein